MDKSELRAALIDNYNRYAQGLDTKDWGMVRGCFSDELALDYGRLGVVTPPGELFSADAWIAQLQSVINGFDITRHTITNHRFVFTDDEIRCTAYLIADHVIFPNPEEPEIGPEDVATVVGEYSNCYEQQADGRWLICASRLDMHWTSGNAALIPIAMERAAALAAS